MRIVPLVLLAGCAATRAVAPLPAGTGAVTSSLGGPVFAFGDAPVPVPLLLVGYRHGITDRTAVHGGLHATSLVLLGVFGADLGLDVELLPPDGARPRLMFDHTITLFAGDNVSGDPGGGVRVFQDFGLIASWDLGDRAHHPYLGVRVFDQPFPERHVYPYPIAGAVLTTGRVGWQVELGWPGVTARNLPSFVDWIGPFHQGALSVQVGATVALDRRSP
jgi:hypothetical protein